MQPFDEVLGGQIDVHDLVRAREEFVGDALFHPHARRALDHVVEALQMLDIERADDVDAGRQEVFHILETLLGFRAGRVGVREFVHQRDGRARGPARRRCPSRVVPRRDIE